MRLRTALLVTFGCVLWSCSDEEDSSTPQLISGAHQLSVDDGVVSLTRDSQLLLRLSLEAFELGIVDALDDELSYDPWWLVSPPNALKPEPPRDLRWRTPAEIEIESQSPDRIELELEYSDELSGELILTKSNDDEFVVDFVPPDEVALAYVRINTQVGETEGFYGLGEWPDSPEHRGKLRPMQLESELAIESASNEAHAPIPLLIGTNGWGLFVESRRAGVFDVATEVADKVAITYAGGPLRVHLFGAENPLDITHHYYRVTGAPKLPAPWTLGPLIWRDENTNQAQVESDIELIRSLDLATSGIWIDRPYATAVNTFDFKPDDYDNPRAMIAKAHDYGLRVGLWHTPYLSDEASALQAEAEEKGFFPPKVGIRLNPWSDPIDFTNAEAKLWWQSKLQAYIDLGIEGFKLDYAEDVSVPGVGGARTPWLFSDDSDDRTMHYDYTVLYHQTYAELLPADGGFLLCRAARWGDQVHAPIIWPGDLDATLTKFMERFTSRDGDDVLGVGGLPAAISMGLSLGPSGFPFYGSDTGGYRHSPPDNETFIRWFQHTALSVVMQVGDSSSQPPWEYNAENGRNDDTLDLYREFARLHLRLFPYLWTHASRLATDGRAIMRPYGLAFPDTQHHPADTYVLGDALLVAPVVTRGAISREVRFPSDGWRHWWHGSEHGEGTETVAAPLEELPLFIRPGGIVPMLRPTIDTLSPVTRPDIDSFASDAGLLYVRIHPSAELTSFTLYDGTLVSAEGDQFEIVPGTVFDGGAVFEILGAAPTAVSIDGTRTASVSWTDDHGGMTRVQVGPGEHAVQFTR